jgi:hypothetical protein
MDIYNEAEELNHLSATYNVEIDGVALQQMSTNELSKVRREQEAGAHLFFGGRGGGADTFFHITGGTLFFLPTTKTREGRGRTSSRH